MGLAWVWHGGVAGGVAGLSRATWVNLVGVSLDPAGRPPLDPTRLIELAPWWTRVEVVPETGSTNADLVERARIGAPEGLVLVAEHQRAGRGRLDRTWASPPAAGLTFSVLLRPGPAAPERWPWLPLLTGVAVVAGIAAAGGPRCALKWPNDVLCGELKLGGLLVERTETPAGAAAVVGVGLNVTTTQGELAVPTATSLALSGMREPDRATVLLAVLAALGEHYAAWRAGSTLEELHTAYAELCATIGRRVEVLLPTGERLHATATGVDRDGALVLDTTTGRRTLTAGDVLHVRPMGAPVE